MSRLQWILYASVNHSCLQLQQERYLLGIRPVQKPYLHMKLFHTNCNEHNM